MFRFPSSAHVISIFALLVAFGSAGYSATGGTFFLGQANSASTQTRLVAPFAGASFRIDNSSTAAGASGMNIVTNAARPPFAVNSSTRVVNLNADKLDGIDSAGFLRIRAETTGAISVSPVPGNSCGPLTLSIAGASVGDAIILTFEGNTAIPAGLTIVAEKVTGADTVQARVCNISNATSSAVSSLGVRVITLR